MASASTCATCGSTSNLKHCARCKTVEYCSADCQRADWKTHKIDCRFTVVTTSQGSASTDALSLLRGMPESGIKTRTTKQTPDAAIKTINIPELRLAIFSLLSAPTLLKVQRVCRSWYHTIALELSLQQRLFIAAGPGQLIFPAREGKKLLMGIQPRNDKQADHVKMQKGPTFGDGARYLLKTIAGDTKEVTAQELEKDGGSMILNPFFTSLWPQDPTNMTPSPQITTPIALKTASWRNMQLTSPPIHLVAMSVC